jgi:hypothetical protein
MRSPLLTARLVDYCIARGSCHLMVDRSAIVSSVELTLGISAGLPSTLIGEAVTAGASSPVSITLLCMLTRV